ncbi:MAG: hypothetical protein IKQ40_07990, partial [Lachnospiraceae bacterium]|nr:hypothetical protein [Lachnospiraceae bacterium]
MTEDGEEDDDDEEDEDTEDRAGKDPDYELIAELTNEVSALTTKVAKYRDAIDNYDKNIETYE